MLVKIFKTPLEMYYEWTKKKKYNQKAGTQRDKEHQRWFPS